MLPAPVSGYTCYFGTSVQLVISPNLAKTLSVLALLPRDWRRVDKFNTFSHPLIAVQFFQECVVNFSFSWWTKLLVTHKQNLVDNSGQTIYIIVQYLAEVISVVGALGMARYDEDDPIGAKSVARPDTSGRDAFIMLRFSQNLLCLHFQPEPVLRCLQSSGPVVQDDSK